MCKLSARDGRKRPELKEIEKNLKKVLDKWKTVW